MEKQKSWQLYLILTVIILTLYNILPTIFYYSKPLGDPINSPKADKIALQIVDRVNSLEEDSKEWLASFTKLLGVSPTSIELKNNNPRIFAVVFKDQKEAALFKRFLPQAGALIPFAPAQLTLFESQSNLDPNTVLVSRQIGIHLNPDEASKLFLFSPKKSENGEISDLYRDIVYDRVTQLALGFGGASLPAQQLAALADAENSNDPRADELTINVAKEILDIEKTFGKKHAFAKRYYNTFTQVQHSGDLIQNFIVRADALKSRLSAERETLLQEQQKLKESGAFLDQTKEQQIVLIDSQRQILESASSFVRKNTELFTSEAKKPLTEQQIRTALAKSEKNIAPKDSVQKLSLEGRNPFIQSLLIEWDNNVIALDFYPDVQNLRLSEETTEGSALMKEKLNQLAINDIARVGRITDENIIPNDSSFAVALNTLPNTQSFLTFNLGYVAEKQSLLIADQLNSAWTPSHTDLSREAYPILQYKNYRELSTEDQKLGIVVYAPAMDETAPLTGFRRGSIYVIARGLDSIIQKYRQSPNTPESQQFNAELQQLNALMQNNGFIGYPGSSYGFSPEFRKDYIYELNDYYSDLLKATRENFVVKGSKRHAVLDFSNVEQRILTLNNIEDRIQEDLLKWREEYNVAQVELDATSKYIVPAPTKNAYWQNFKLSFAKYFRGDDRKVLKWGLDLSGGKTVRIGLRDHNNRPVTDPNDLRQAVNELYSRVNNMGVSERTIHIEDNNIVLDFPGSQELSAADLVKASAMYFHIVNEKFTPNNPELKEPISQFLQDVWNEAVVTNRKDIESINLIAWEHLGGDLKSIELRPMSDAAKQLYESGLRLANPIESAIGHDFNDSISRIAIMRGSDFTEWQGQTNPLLVIFHNYALEGSSLNNIQVGYDPMQGNILSFGVKRSYEGKGGGNPRDDFYAWTSQFSEERIAGTAKETYSHGHGWRMAVILNGSIISSPTLKAALRDGATVSGRFSQREVTQLAADLKAGSLSFTPRILSEQNVSPELGKEERFRGIVASLVALALVVIGMVGYYHFAGIVASCAVLFNILIMWGVLQNLDAVLTLPGIAGIVLTIGMAVDANVLVFERIREEFSLTGRIASAIQAGYKKAFTAIVDSNITTIIAALILIQFDSGPIKGFAVTLIIGIISSMFTSLFMTRYFFAGWVQNPENKSLSMSQFIGNTHFDFLAQAKKAIIVSLVVMAVGGTLFVAQYKTLFGMDFTGGYSLMVELAEKEGDTSYRAETSEALLAGGATANDFHIRELSRPNQLRIQLGISMEEKGHPFYQLPESLPRDDVAYEYQKNPRIDWVVDALAKANLNIQKSELDHLERNWSVVSGQLSDTMRNNAIYALGLALLSILIYITIRFEFKYAIAAVIGLVHDVLITLGILALFHKLGFAVQIDLQVIGAIMTIIGYSLNDTIIVFDRIREDLHLMRKKPFYDVINHALNVTLSRTIMTSGTTLLVLLALVFLGGHSIFAFSLVMTIGVLVGTASSLFIATPMLLYFHNRELRQEEEKAGWKKA